MMEYVTGWVEAMSIKDCTMETTIQFILDNVITRFVCLEVLMSDRGAHFLNDTICMLT
jgi:hypothetical protein